MRQVVAIIFLGLMVLCGSVYAACYNECKPLPNCAKMGYKLEEEISCPDGAITCPFDNRYKWCKEYKCEDGRYSDNETLTGEKGYRCDAVDYHHRTCYNCRCAPDPNECKWSNLNKGNGELGDRCCDGHFATCTNLCQNTVEVPLHAHGISESCTGCDETVSIITSWKCNEWYDQMGEECYPRKCEGDSSIVWPDVNHCGTKSLGEKGWTWQSHGMSGENVCGECTPKLCDENYNTSADVADCNFPGTKYAEKEASTTRFNGDNTCYKCVCKATESNCPWEEGSEGQGSLGEKCCNGRYASCTSNCQKAEVPPHGKCTDYCTGCNEQVCTAWTCNEGYEAKDDTCVAAQCPVGYDTNTQTTASCRPEGTGWSIGFQGQSGEIKCGKCVCTSDCKWNNSNKGEKGELSGPCCNSKYANCVNKCPDVQVPEHAHGIEPCVACEEETKYGNWECDEGFLKLDGGCVEQCKDPQVDYETCWNGNFKPGTLMSDCDRQGYKDAKGACDNFIACPTNADKIRCVKSANP